MAASEAARRASAAVMRRQREARSASMPAGSASSRNGSVCAVWSKPVSPAPAPKASTAMMGAAARPICSADCAARLDQARRLKAGDRRVAGWVLMAMSLAAWGTPLLAREFSLAAHRGACEHRRRGLRLPCRLDRRAAEVIALEEGDAMMGQELRLLRSLHAFGDGGEAEAFAQPRQGADEELVVEIAGDIADEGAVDLYEIQGQGLEMAERSVARAEVERHLAAELAQRGDEMRHLVEIGHGGGLGDLNDEPLGDVGAVLDEGAEEAEPGAVEGGDARDIHGEDEIAMLAQVGDGEFERAPVDGADEPEIIDNGNELTRGHKLARLAAHAEQAFVEGDLVVRRIHDRLIGEDKAPVAKGGLDLLEDLDMAPVVLTLLLRVAVADIVVAAALARRLERQIGLRHHVRRDARAVRKNHGADRDRDMDGPARRLDRASAHRFQDFLGGRGQIALAALPENDAEAVIAGAADDIARAQAAIEPIADLDDDLIDALIAEGLAQEAELVDTDGEIAAGDPVARCIGERMVEGFAQARAIIVPGQLVIAREIFEPCLVLLARGDNAQHAGKDARLAVGAEAGSAAIVHPLEFAVVGAHPVFAIVVLAGDKMVREGEPARRRVLGVEATLEGLSAAARLEAGDAEQVGGTLRPAQAVGGEIPFVENITGGGERGPQPGQLLAILALGAQCVLHWP